MANSPHFWTYCEDHVYEDVAPEDMVIAGIHIGANCTLTWMADGEIRTCTEAYPPKEGAYETRADALRALLAKVEEQVKVYESRAGEIELEIIKEEQT